MSWLIRLSRAFALSSGDRLFAHFVSCFTMFCGVVFRLNSVFAINSPLVIQEVHEQQVRGVFEAEIHPKRLREIRGAARCSPSSAGARWTFRCRPVRDSSTP